MARGRGVGTRRAGLLAVLALSGALLGAPVSRAASEVEANGAARVVSIAPVSGGLALAVGLGSAIADVTGTTPRGESATLKPGIVGLLAGSTVPLPSPSKADLRGEPSVDRTAVVPALGLGGVTFSATRERAAVTSAEDDAGLGATARTDLTDIEVTELVEVSGGTASASATTKLATAGSAVGRITISVAGTPLVDLKGLEWRVESPLGKEPVATFSVGSAVIQGDRQAVDSPEDLRAALEPLAPLFAPAGIAIRVPTVTELEGGAAVSPLVIESVNAELLRSSVGALYPQLAPVYNDLATQLQDQAAEAGLALLAANVGLSIAAGNGGARIVLGGASASIVPRAGFGGGGGGDSGDLAGTARPTSPAGSTASPPFFSGGPAERVQLAAAPTSTRRGTAASSGPGGGSGDAPVALAVTPTSTDDDGGVPATAVMALALAGITALAARDQTSVRRRDALRQARARTRGASDPREG